MAETIFEKNGTRLTVILEGRLDTLSASVLEKKMQQHLDGIREVIMDFEKVEYLSSSALRVLLATEQLTKTRGGGVKLLHVNERIMEIFNLVGFLDVVEVVPD
ncbi:MAG: STAS domain-containing protein [Clostridia bacterium]|jgi:anti-anti-sigma factor|nr:STAS domain-containing protein [Clostridia bacterium]